MIVRKAIAAAALVAGMLVLPAAAQADFGFVPGSLRAEAINQDGTVADLAGSHPYSYSVSMAFNTLSNGKVEGGAPRDIIADLPAGFLGNPLAVPRCTRQDFEGVLSKCPTDTQVGVVRALLVGLGETRLPLFNLEPSPGNAAQLGASAVNLNVLQNASVLNEEGYAVRVGAFNIPAEVSAVTEVIWGIPSDSSHDAERGGQALDGGPPVKSSAPRLPFLTLPTSCEAPPRFTVSADSKLDPGNFVSESTVARDAGGNPAALAGCGGVPFTPTISSSPTSQAAESPAGLDFQLKLPNAGLLSSDGIAETEPVKTEVALPPGVTVNPSAANGIAACSEAQYAAADGSPGQGCPEASKIGTLVASSPLLEEAIEGSVYLAQPRENRFGSLLALYIVASAPQRGVLVKQAGEVQADPATGQLKTTFDELPPLPYSSFELKLREGPRAPLITPQGCGTYETEANLYPFSAPTTATVRKAPFKVISGAGGGSCPDGEAQMPNRPAFDAGTVTPVAGAYSPFVFNLSRQDGEQRFSSISATLPTGLVGKLANVPYCPESAIATATSRTEEGGGALENSSPSCPVNSQVGTVSVAAGAGPSPYSVQGKVYLAGPYKGGPLSLVVITPAIAGPFDLGSVAIRTALQVDPFTAQIHATSDPLPAILHGIPLDVRSVSLQMNEPEFTLNPTNCSEKSVAGQVTSLTGSGASLLERFQVGGCAGLDFAPKLKLSLKGATKRSGHPALKAVLTFPKGSTSANIARAQVGLPHSEFLDQGSIQTVCTQPQLKSDSCPAASIYGRATAYTPLLDKPLTGPVYLGTGFGHTLPDLVADLDGQIRVLVHGRVDTTPQDGLRNTFEAVPDAPVSKFVLEMKGGKKGLLENSVNICKRTHRAEVRLTAQSGRVAAFKTPISNSCRGGRR